MDGAHTPPIHAHHRPTNNRQTRKNHRRRSGIVTPTSSSIGSTAAVVSAAGLPSPDAPLCRRARRRFARSLLAFFASASSWPARNRPRRHGKVKLKSKRAARGKTNLATRCRDVQKCDAAASNFIQGIWVGLVRRKRRSQPAAGIDSGIFSKQQQAHPPPRLFYA